MKKLILLYFILFSLLVNFAYADSVSNHREFSSTLQQLDKKCNENDYLSCFLAGQIYENSFMKFSALNNYKKACDNNVYEACVMLGDIYLNDVTSSDKNLKTAFKLFKKACFHHIDGGCLKTAYMYDIGKGVKKSLKNSLKYFKTACKMNNAFACYNAGSMYYYGLGDKMDFTKALKYTDKSCKLQYEPACTEYDSMLNRGEYFK